VGQAKCLILQEVLLNQDSKNLLKCVFRGQKCFFTSASGESKKTYHTWLYLVINNPGRGGISIRLFLGKKDDMGTEKSYPWDIKVE
jgi:hypothetical protein